MSQTFYWYDYETWGINPRINPPAQFGGLRTDLDFNQIGEPLVIFNRPSDDILPDPDAVMITGITPQMAAEKGIKEAEFARQVHNQLAKPGTISLGFNTIRFDEVFNRFLFWRNFYDPYEHSWKDNTSCWDIIDMVRLTRALRPEGITWPFENGKPTNRLEQLSAANNIEHSDAHDALADVYATIEVAKLIKKNQPKLFQFCFEHRDKKSVAQLLNPSELIPVVHASDKFGSECLSTALVVPVVSIENNRQVLVVDLKKDPTQLLDLNETEIAQNLFTHRRDLPKGTERFGVKGIKLNASPVLAPESTLDDAAAERIQLDKQKAKKHLAQMAKYQTELARKLEIVFTSQQPLARYKTSEPAFADAEGKLYDAFISDAEKAKAEKVRNGELDMDFQDERLKELLVHYKARNFPASLTEQEQIEWEKYRREKLTKSTLNFETFGHRLAELAKDDKLKPPEKHLLEQLQIYAESIYPYDT